MSDTRAAIRELRSLSEKRSTQGLNVEERVRLDELRQRLGLPPEPELGAAMPSGSPVASQEASAPAIRRPSLAERIDATVGMPDPGVAPARTHPAGMNGTAAAKPVPAPLPLPAPVVPPASEVASLSAEPPVPEAPTVAAQLGSSAPAPMTGRAPPSGLPAELLARTAFTPLPSFGSLDPLPPPVPPPGAETFASADAPEALQAPEAPPAAETFAGFDAPDALQVPEPPPAAETFAGFDPDALQAPEAPPAAETFAGFDPDALQAPEAPPAAETFAGFDPDALQAPEAPPAAETFAGFDPDAAQAPEAPPAAETFAGFDPDALQSPEAPPAAETFAGFDPDALQSPEAPPAAETFAGFDPEAMALEGAEAQPAGDLPPDGPLPGDPGTEGEGAEPLPPDTGSVPEVPAEEGFGAEPLTPAVLPLDGPLPGSGGLVLAPEDLGATPLDVLPEGELHAQPLEESGPIELSAADVMLLEDDPRRDVSDLELGGDAAEPVPLAEAHDFVQYHRQDEGAIALEPAAEGEGLGDPALVQASEAELATQAAPFVRPPAAPSLRVPPPPSSSAPLPRTATVPSMPAPRPPAPIPAASVPAARPPAPPPPSATAQPLPRPAASVPPPPPPAAAGRSTPTAPPAPTPLAPVAPTPAPAARPAPSFPTLTRAAPVSPQSQPGRSGPFARPPPSLMPAAALDTMDEEPAPSAPGNQPPVFGGPYLSPTFVEGEHRVVLHTLEGQVRRGTVSDVDLLDPVIRLSPPGALPDAIPAERIKAIFFMQGPGDAPLPQHGQRIRVSFSDGRQIVGFSEDVEVGENGFFLIPADLRTHTARIYVFRAGVHSITRA